MEKELLEVLKKLKEELPVIGKNLSVDFGSTHFKYAPLEKVWAEVKDTLKKNGFVIYNEITLDGVKTIACHEFGELTSIVPFSPTVSRPQERGAEITYYRRYNLTAIFNIMVVGEDNELLLLQNKEKPVNGASKITTVEQYNKCTQSQKEKVKAYYGSLQDIPFIEEKELLTILT